MTIASTLILYIRQMSHFFLIHTQKRGLIPLPTFLHYNPLSTLYYTFAD